jgi:hypothetical protein
MPVKFPFEQFFKTPFFTVDVLVSVPGATTPVPFTAMKYPIGEKLEALAAFGESYSSWEFMFQVEDLQLAGLTGPLPDATYIVESGRKFQVTPFQNQPHYRWVDPDQTTIAFRCKEVAAI